MQLTDGGAGFAPASSPVLSPEDQTLVTFAGAALHLMRPLPAFGGAVPTLGLAVSGGSDSMAMLHLMARAAPLAGWRLQVASVDHRLRPEAAEEVRFVGESCARLGLPHEIMVWDDHPTRGNMHDAARKGRYALLAAWAQRNGFSDIALGHTSDDQAETFLMGLSRAAGLEGLSGMRPSWVQNGSRFHRPFLTLSRESLRDHLRRQGVSWRDDPSNEMERYSRTKARRALKALKPLGITADRLNESLRNLAEGVALIRHETARRADALCQDHAGAVSLSRPAFLAEHPEMQRRLIVALIRWLSGADYPPRANTIASLLGALKTGQKAATLGGCRFLRLAAKDGAETILITREPRAVEQPQPWTAARIWDHRWQITGPEAPQTTLRALGTEGLTALPDWRDSGLRREALLVSPSLWQGDRLISAPLLRHFSGEYSACLHPSFGSFVLSH